MEPPKERYDCVILGTSLANSVLAAALARCHKNVLHLDARDHYGEHWATFDLAGLARVVQECSAEQHQGFLFGARLQPGCEDGWQQCLANKEHERRFALDTLCRPLYSSGPLVELLVRAGVGKYLEFKCLQGDLLGLPEKADLMRVPASKGDVFQSSDISLLEKRLLMKFLQQFLGGGGNTVSEEWLARPFAEFLKENQIEGTLASVIWYAICGRAPDQHTTTAVGTRLVRLYLSSVGKFGKTPFLHPLYGSSEASQAFCRLAAVHGCVYMLRTPVQTVEPRQQGGGGGLLVNGEFECDWLVSSLDYAPLLLAGNDGAAATTTTPQVPPCYHAVCWLAQPLVGTAEEPLVHVRWARQGAVVHGVQLDSTMHVCPAASFVLHVWSDSLAALEAVLPSTATWTVRYQTQPRVVPHAALMPNVLFLSDPSALEDDFASAIAEAEKCFRIIVGDELPFLPEPEEPRVEDE